MSRFFKVAKVSQVRPGHAITVKTRYGEVAIFNVNGKLFALDAHCIRCTARVATGKCNGESVSCRCGWRYEVDTGAVVQLPRLRLDTHIVKVVGSSIMLGNRFATRRNAE
jgi:nitrite reductase/ring-hydroxylating ferredoxin subunit